MAYQVKWLSSEKEAITHMPWTGLSREECRLVSCPKCGAGSTDKCRFPLQGDTSIKRPAARIHRARVLKAKEYRAEHRI